MDHFKIFVKNIIRENPFTLSVANWKQIGVVKSA